MAGHSWEHRHAQDELTWVVAGSAVLRIGNAEYRVGTGNALWIPAGTSHLVKTAPGSLIFPLFFDRGELGPVPGQVFLLDRDVELEAISRILLQPGLNTQHARAQKKGQLGEYLRARAGRRSIESEVTYPANPFALRVAHALTAQPDSPLSLEQWARTASMSARTLQRHFMRETGHTFGQWRMQVRMAVASTLLRQGLPVALVAARVGYSSPAAFTAAFGRSVGTQPSRLHPRETRGAA